MRFQRERLARGSQTNKRTHVASDRLNGFLRFKDATSLLASEGELRFSTPGRFHGWDLPGVLLKERFSGALFVLIQEEP